MAILGLYTEMVVAMEQLPYQGVGWGQVRDPLRGASGRKTGPTRMIEIPARADHSVFQMRTTP
jgi:hypothetical protein